MRPWQRASSRGPVDSVAGWVPAAPAEPPWWLSPLAPMRPTLLPQPVPAPVAAPATAAAAPTLFDDPAAEPPVSRSDPVATLVDELVGSPVFLAQRRRAGRTAPDDSRVGAVLSALLRNDGRLHETTLAAAAQIPAARLRNVLAAVRKLLNVEGYDVLGLDADQVTVVLDLTLLREQFQIGPPA